MNDQNRLYNTGNPAQGEYKKVLCLCSAGLLRSPTAAFVLSNPPFSYNTRAAGVTPSYALVKVDAVLLHWADEIVCMNQENVDELCYHTGVDIEGGLRLGKPVIVLGIDDNFRYRDPQLMQLIAERYQEYLDKLKEPVTVQV